MPVIPKGSLGLVLLDDKNLTMLTLKFTIVTGLQCRLLITTTSFLVFIESVSSIVAGGDFSQLS